MCAALLHDIGYAPGLLETGSHSIDGARHLERHGYPPRLVALVAHHSAARFEAHLRGLADELACYPLEEGPVMDALVYADMTTGPQGQRLAYADRIDEILRRYDPTTEVHRAIVRARPFLDAHILKVERRLTIAYAIWAGSPGPQASPCSIRSRIDGWMSSDGS